MVVRISVDMEEEPDLSELLQEVEQQFWCYKEKSDKRFQEIEKAISVAAQQMEILIQRKASRKSKKIVNISAQRGIANDNKDTFECMQHLKLNFPRFVEETGATEWIQDCEHYFALYGVGESKKVAVAGMHLQGIARRWFQTYTIGGNKMEWTTFCKQFISRFGTREQETLYDNFKHLKQTTTIELYFDQFEKYQEQLKGRMPDLTEEYFVECFVGGLQDKIKETLKLLAPLTVDQAYRQAKKCVGTERIAKDSK